VWNVNDCLWLGDTPSSRRPIVVGFHIKGRKEVFVVFNVVKTIIVLIDKVVAGVGVITKIYFVLSDDGGVVLVVVDSASFEFYKDGLCLVRKVKGVVGGGLVEKRAEISRENVDVPRFACSSEEEVVLLVSHLFIYERINGEIYRNLFLLVIEMMRRVRS
jgi:nitrate reductase NapAB chaperone NapD